MVSKRNDRLRNMTVARETKISGVGFKCWQKPKALLLKWLPVTRYTITKIVWPRNFAFIKTTWASVFFFFFLDSCQFPLVTVKQADIEFEVYPNFIKFYLNSQQRRIVCCGSRIQILKNKIKDYKNIIHLKARIA